MTVMVSSMGKPRMMSGRKGLKGVFCCVSATGRTIARNPINWLPESPMKITAGCVLYRKKPKMAPAAATALIAIAMFSQRKAR